MNPINLTTYRKSDHIGVLTLGMPPGNYLPVPEFITPDVMAGIERDEDLKGLIIAGEGRNFSAGGDLPAIFSMAIDPESLAQVMLKGSALLERINMLNIPVVAAINGICFGGGLEIALACHIRVASENALLAFPETNHQLMPGMGGSYRLPAISGKINAMTMLLGGDTIDVHHALKMGLVDHLAPKNGALAFADELLRKLTHERNVKTIRSVMKALHFSQTHAPDESMKEEIKLFCELAIDEAERRKKEEKQ